jgi:hypothetical protein
VVALFALFALFALAAIALPGGIEATAGALSDAYLAVSVFVAATIALVLTAERGLALATLLSRYRRGTYRQASCSAPFPVTAAPSPRPPWRPWRPWRPHTTAKRRRW